MSASVLGHPALPSRWQRLLALVRTRPRVSQEALILFACLYFSLFANAVFWQSAAPHPWQQWRWTLSLFLLVTAVHGIWLSLLVWRRTARVVLSALVVVAAMAGHYMAAYGIYIDADMIRNVLHTDWREASDLMGGDILVPLLVALPALLVIWRVRLRDRRWTRALGMRAAFLAGMVVTGVLGVLPSTQQLTAFLRNQREVRYLVTPANVLVSLAKVVSEEPPGHRRVLQPIGEDAVQSPAATMRRPRLLVLVVGETARAANWGLNGYARQTTPELAKRDVLNFPHVTACGSSTEVSLPCMFSPWGRHAYDEARIRGHQSLLHVLEHAGITTLWRDNQSGCKGVCEGLATESLADAADPALCADGRCLDEILLAGMAERVRSHPGDRVVVLHPLGNHGPSYFERYPPAFRRHTPTCDTADLGRCSRQQIVNSYDNALLYTDHLLARTIDTLGTMHDYDTAMIYLSDHGESLGEKGLYLHGVPWMVAPEQQTRVPMVMWFSAGFAADRRLDLACVRARATAPTDQDVLFSSVLGLMQVRTALYERGRDVFAGCTPDA